MKKKPTLAEVTKERDDLQRTFDLQWRAEMRAIKEWQAAHPGNDLVWPDKARMTIWLLERDAAQRKELAQAVKLQQRYAEELAATKPAKAEDEVKRLKKAMLEIYSYAKAGGAMSGYYYNLARKALRIRRTKPKG